MKCIRYFLALFALVLLSPSLLASVTVDSVNFPVWIERDGKRLPAAPGDQLESGDVVQTGLTGRAWLSAEDGSAIKLGQATRFTIERSGFRDDAGTSIWDAGFNVLKGAFRFTSGFFVGPRKAGHEVDFQVGAVTIGVRGTDIWGRSGDDEDFVALLEGRIEASSAGDEAVLMETPLTLYRKAEGQPADPVAPVAAEVVADLAPETELDRNAGLVSRNGHVTLVVQSFQFEDLANAAVARFHDAGYPVVTSLIDVNGQSFIRIQMDGLASRRSALSLANELSENLGVEGAWISTGSP